MEVVLILIVIVIIVVVFSLYAAFHRQKLPKYEKSLLTLLRLKTAGKKFLRRRMSSQRL